LYWSFVIAPSASVAARFSVTSTPHCRPFARRTVVTDVTCVPVTTAGPRTYSVPAASQETTWLSGAFHCAAV